MVLVLSIVIVTYNTRDIILKCLEWVYRSGGKDCEVIVIDNGSSDETSRTIGQYFKAVKVFRNDNNLGFAKANNQGMALAKGEWILLLNSDCFLFEDTLAKISQFSISNFQKADVVGCQLLNKDGTIQPSWGYFPTLKRILLMMLFVDNLPVIRDTVDSIHVRSEMRYDKTTGVDWVTGAFVMLKREVFQKTGGIDENYFMYGEEAEWMYRIKQAGFKVSYTPEARAVHLLGASSPDRAPAIIGEMRGWLYWFGKHNKPWEQKVLPYVIMLGCALRIVLKPTLAEHYKTALKEIWDEVSGRTGKSAT